MLPPRPLPPPDPESRQRGLAALTLGGLSLIGLALGLGNLHRGIYVAVLTLLFAMTAIWLGATVDRRARRSGTARPRGAVSGIVLGGLGFAFSVMWLLVLAVFWPQLNTYHHCMAGAEPGGHPAGLHTQLSNSVGGELSVLQNGK